MRSHETGTPASSWLAGERRGNAKILGSTYGLLARVFASEVDPELLDSMRSSGIAAWLSDAGEPLDPGILEGDRTRACETLAVEYTRLFLGPGPHVSPHESVWCGVAGTPGLHWGEETARVRRFVRALGMEYRSEFHHLPDHVSAQLELAASLAAQEEAALGDGKVEDADRFREIRLRFLREHLGKWVGRFAEEVEVAQNFGFYGPFARLAEALVRTELDQEVRKR